MKAWGGVILACCLSGCATWIVNPSPATRSLIENLKYEGFACRVEVLSVVCESKAPVLERSGFECSSSEGCIKKDDFLVFAQYTIKEGEGGVPVLKSKLRRIRAPASVAERPAFR